MNSIRALSRYGLQRKHAPDQNVSFHMHTTFCEHVALLISHISCKCAHLSLHHTVSLKCIRVFPLTGDLCAALRGDGGCGFCRVCIFPPCRQQHIS